METAVTKRSAPVGGAIKDWLTSDQLKTQLTQALPQICTPERFMRVLFTAMQKTPALMRCSQASLFQAFLNCASLGLEPDGRRAHLIPYGSVCNCIIDYKGLVELVKRSGDVLSVRAEKVCDNDFFSYEDGKITHKIDFRNPRGEAYAYYAIAKLKDGTEQNIVMTKDEVNAIRKRAKAGNNGPWVTDYDEMAKKTAFRRLTKWLVLSPEVHQAIDTMDKAEFSSKNDAVSTADVISAALDEQEDAEPVFEAETVSPANGEDKSELEINDTKTPRVFED